MVESNATSQKVPRELSAKQEQVALRLAAGWQVTKAADECKISTKTIYEWKKTIPEFQLKVDSLRKELLDGAINRLKSLMANESLDSLTKLVESAPSDELRLEAIKTVYDLYLNTTRQVDFASKVAGLEAQQGG